MLGYIYKFENVINGKIYIGKTKDINKRIYQHLKVTSTKNTKFGNALSKYGIDNFKFTVELSVRSADIHKLNIVLSSLERFCIKKYGSFYNGYNCTLGGEGTLNFRHSSDTILKFRNRKHSEYTKSKMSNSKKGKKINRRVTDKWRAAIIEIKSIPIVQYSLDNIFIKKWNSISEAARYYNISKSCICRVCKKERKSCKGFIWRYY